MQQNIEKITKLAEEVLAPSKLSLIDIRFGQSGKEKTLELTIFRPEGKISMTDCEEVSRSLEIALDKENPPLVPGSFLLQVQSPGIDRQLTSAREFQIFQGHEVEVKSKEEVEGLGVHFKGTLLDQNFSNGSGQITLANLEPIVESNSKGKKQKKSVISKIDKLNINLSSIISIRLHPIGGQSVD